MPTKAEIVVGSLDVVRFDETRRPEGSGLASSTAARLRLFADEPRK